MTTNTTSLRRKTYRAAGRVTDSGGGRRARLGVQQLEDRTVPATILVQLDPLPGGQGPDPLATDQTRIDAANIGAVALRDLDDGFFLASAPETYTFEDVNSAFTAIAGFRALRPNHVGNVTIFDENGSTAIPAVPGQWILQFDMIGSAYEQERLAQAYLDTLEQPPTVLMHLGRDGEFLITTTAGTTTAALDESLQIIPIYQGIEANRFGWIRTWFPNADADADQVVSNSWVMQFENMSGATFAERAASLQYQLNEARTGTTTSAMVWSDVASIQSEEGMSYERLHELLSLTPGYMGIGPNAIIRSSKTPTDPDYATKQYGLNNTGQIISDPDFSPAQSFAGKLDADVDAPEAWDITTGSKANVVAVLDTGIDLQHPDLIPNLWLNTGEIPNNGKDDDGNDFIDDVHGFNFVGSSATNFPVPYPIGAPGGDDDEGHGTLVAGIIGANANTTGSVGLNWDVQLMAVKILNSLNGGEGNIGDAINGLNYVNLMRSRGVGIKVSNNSWGGPVSSPTNLSALGGSIGAAQILGILAIAAAGNGRPTTFGQIGVNLDTLANKVYPASFDRPNVITVAATQNRDDLAQYSNYGSSVDVAAPGSGIFSTIPISGAVRVDPTGYFTDHGTSFSAPFVSGAALLAWAKTPGTSYTEVRDQILRNGDPITISNGKNPQNGQLTVPRSLGLNGTNNIRLNVYAELVRANNSLVVTGADAGGGPHVRAFFPRPNGTQVESYGFFAYPPNFTGGVRVATGDVNGDGIEDIITVPGVGTSTNLGPLVRVWDGVDHHKIAEFYAYVSNQYNGLFLAAGDTNGDGKADIVVAPDAGAAPHVKVFSGANFGLLFDYFAYSVTDAMGVRLATGDVNHDGSMDVITGPGPGGGPRIKVTSGAGSHATLKDFYAYATNHLGGVFVAGTNANGDSFDDIAVSPVEYDAALRPVKVFNGKNSSLLYAVQNFSGFAGGVRIAAVDYNGDGDDELLLGAGSGPSAQVQVWDHSFAAGTDLMVSSMTPYGAFNVGVFVTGTRSAQHGYVEEELFF